MSDFLKNYRREILPLSLILILVLARLIPHPPNFTPIVSVAILSGYFFKNVWMSIFTLLTSMLLADIFIGFYNNMMFVYLSLILISLVFYKYGKKINLKNLFIYGFIGSLLFFIISNFGVWLLGDLYEKNFQGLVSCYILAIPFFTNTFFSTLIFLYPSIFLYKSLYNRA